MYACAPQIIEIHGKTMQRGSAMQTSAVKTASTVMYGMGIYTFVMSLFWIFLTDVIFVSDFLAFTGQSSAEFLASSPAPAEVYLLTKKLWGVTMLLISFLTIFITKKSCSKGEKWSWYAFLITGFMLGAVSWDTVS